MKNLKQFTKIELTYILEFIENSLKFSFDEPFHNLTNYLKPLIPHDSIICGYVQVNNKSLEEIKKVVNVSYPQDWLDIYFANKLHLIDPIAMAHFGSFKPQRWSETYKKHLNLDKNFISMARDFGLCEGLTHGVFEQRDSSGSIFSFSGPSLKTSNKQLLSLDIVIPYLHTALIRFCRNRIISEERGLKLPLSQREIEILNWVKEGKTNWEISVILAVSERTVKFHVINILQKLNASTRGHAVSKALDLEIIIL